MLLTGSQPQVANPGNAVIDPLLHERLIEHWSSYRPEPFCAELGGCKFALHPGVFNAADAHSTRSMLEHMTVPRCGEVLDMGCGAGVLGILAVLGGARSALLVDRNPAAVANARANIAHHSLQQQCEAIDSDLFTAVGTRTFDVIYFNLPFIYIANAHDTDHLMPNRAPMGQTGTPTGQAGTPIPPSYTFFDAGYQIIDRFLGQASTYLKARGRIEFSFADYGNRTLLAHLLHKHRWLATNSALATDSQHGHEYIVYSARPAAGGR